jgi:hypothetical protein
MIDKFIERSAPLLNYKSSLVEIVNFLRKCGWMNVSSYSMNQAINIFITSNINQLNKDNDTNKEPFDEYSSLAMLNKSYSITIASNSKNNKKILFFDKLLSKSSNSYKLNSRNDINNDTLLINALLSRLQVAENRLMSIEGNRKLIIVENEKQK